MIVKITVVIASGKLYFKPEIPGSMALLRTLQQMDGVEVVFFNWADSKNHLHCLQQREKAGFVIFLAGPKGSPFASTLSNMRLPGPCIT